jgi:hypothetical protein
VRPVATANRTASGQGAPRIARLVTGVAPPIVAVLGESVPGAGSTFGLQFADSES